MTVCLLQFAVALGMGVQEALASGKLDRASFWSAVISALVAVIKARAPEVTTGLRIFDKPHDQRNP